jgi:hypothetical protein
MSVGDIGHAPERDSIFGDWFVLDAELEARNGLGHIIPIEENINIQRKISVPFPHWCFPNDKEYCAS